MCANESKPLNGDSNGLEIKWLRKRFDLCEIYSFGLEYCFVNADNQQCCAFVHCKDFLHDAVAAVHNKRAIEVYGFKYDPKSFPVIDLNRTRLVLASSSDDDFQKRISGVVDFVNQFEAKLHLIRTIARQVANPPKRYRNRMVLFEGSNRWLLAPPMLSLYALLLRVGFCHKKGRKAEETIKKIKDGFINPYQEEDASQLREARSGIDRILKNGYTRIFWNEPAKNYPAMDDMYDLHDAAGICSLGNGGTKSICSHWTRKLTKSKKSSTKKPV